MPKHSSHILELAKKGAEARFRELLNEASLLINSFPHLRDAFDKDQLPISFVLKRDADRRNAKAGRRRKMSAAARKAVSDRMTKYWAARRREEAQATAETGKSPAEPPHTRQETTAQQAPAKRKASAKRRATKRPRRKSRKARR